MFAISIPPYSILCSFTVSVASLYLFEKSSFLIWFSAHSLSRRVQTTTFLYSFVSENYFFIVLRIELASLKEDSSTSLIAFLKCYYLLPFGKQDPIVIYIYYQVYDMMCDLFLYHTQQSINKYPVS